jgi:hypothetical protein
MRSYLFDVVRHSVYSIGAKGVLTVGVCRRYDHCLLLLNKNVLNMIKRLERVLRPRIRFRRTTGRSTSICITWDFG